MKNSAMSLLIIIIGAAILIGFNGLSWAICTDLVCVDLTFDKGSYAFGEPVGATITVTNNSGRNLDISQGFGEKDYFLEMRVIDPAGRLVSAVTNIEHAEFPDAPPLPFCRRNNGTFTQVAPYEVLPVGPPITSHIDDLLKYYSMKFPGTYSFEVQLSAMTFKPPAQTGQCGGDINDPEYVGAFKSETKYVYAQGSTNIVVVPNKWLISWQDDQSTYPRPELSVKIWPGAKMTADDYATDHIQLNNVPATRVFKQYSSTKQKYYLRAFFARKDALNSLGDVQVGHKYSVVVSGTMKNGSFFGGGAKVKIINY